MIRFKITQCYMNNEAGKSVDIKKMGIETFKADVES